MNWLINKDGSYEIAWGDAIIKDCFPAFDYLQIHPISVNTTENSIEYILSGEQRVCIEFVYTASADEIEIRSSLHGFAKAPRFFKPIAGGQLVRVDRMFKQGFGFGGPSGIYFLNDDCIREKVLESYMITGLIDTENRGMVIGAMDTYDFMNKSCVYTRYDRAGLNDQSEDGQQVFFENGFSTECIDIITSPVNKEAVLTLPALHLYAPSAPVTPSVQSASSDPRSCTPTSGAGPESNLFETFREFANKLARNNNVKPLKKPCYHYCSWYLRGPYFGMEDLHELLDGLEKIEQATGKIGMQAIQIDHGYSKHTGDWLLPSERFPNGMEEAFSLIRKNGYAAGVWVAPFMVGSRSEVACKHPEWLLRNHDDSLVIEKSSPDAGSENQAMADEHLYVLDTSHPDAFEYLRTVFKTLRKWGVTLYKTDFMDWGHRDSSRYKRHTPGKTSTQYFVDVLRMIRQEIGDESYWLACIAPFAPFVGFADGMRIGNDITCNWSDGGVKGLICETVADQYFNNVLWQNDPDVSYVRDILTKFNSYESRSIAMWNAMSGGSVNTSDPLHKISSDALTFWRSLIPSTNHKTATYPGWGMTRCENCNTVIRQLEADDGLWTRVNTELSLTSAKSKLSLVYIFNNASEKQGVVRSIGGLIENESAHVYRVTMLDGAPQLSDSQTILDYGEQTSIYGEIEAHAGGLFILQERG